VPAACAKVVDEATLQQCAPALAKVATSTVALLRWPEHGTVFPPDLAPPTFLFEEVLGARAFALYLQAGTQEFFYPTVNNGFFPPLAHWNRLKRVGRDSTCRALLIALDGGGRVLDQDLAEFSFAPEPVGDSIFFREVPLPFSLAVKDPSVIRWRLGSVAVRESPKVVLDGLPVCGNCHSFSKDGSVLGLDVDYANDKGNYAMMEVKPRMQLSRDKIFSWSDFQRDDGGVTFGLLSQVSPDGRYAVSTVKDRSVFVALDDDIAYSQLFFPVKGILAIYDTQTKQFASLPGADDPDFVQSNPVWGPDGSYLLFAKAPKVELTNLAKADKILLSTKEAEDFVKRRTLVRFDLMKIPFNGGRGGEAVALEGASGDGRSNFFPKVSPDGRWIVFCKSEAFMLLQADSRLFIVPAEGGQPRELEANRKGMNSWHSWSSNSRWLVFASKAEGRYTKLLLTYVDAQGKSHPPVLLDWMTASDRAANIPEFVPLALNAMDRIIEDFLDDTNFLRAGGQAMQDRDYPLAVAQYRLALESNPGNPQVLERLALATMAAGDSNTAVSMFETVVKSQPDNSSAAYNLALLKRQKGNPEEALTMLEGLKGKEEDVPGLPLELAKLYRQLGRSADSLAAFRQAVELQPEDQQIRYLMCIVLLEMGRAQEAVVELETVVKGRPEDLASVDLLATAQGLKGDYPGAARTAAQALELAKKQENADKVKELTDRIELYRQGKPWAPQAPKAPQAPQAPK
jgi:tetratricopeptide (TPR) repeat protein